MAASVECGGHSGCGEATARDAPAIHDSTDSLGLHGAGDWEPVMTPGAIRIERPDVDQAVAEKDMHLDPFRPIRDIKEALRLRAKTRLADAAVELVIRRRVSVTEAARMMGCARKTVHKALAWVRRPM